MTSRHAAGSRIFPLGKQHIQFPGLTSHFERQEQEHLGPRKPGIRLRANEPVSRAMGCVAGKVPAKPKRSSSRTGVTVLTGPPLLRRAAGFCRTLHKARPRKTVGKMSKKSTKKLCGFSSFRRSRRFAVVIVLFFGFSGPPPPQPAPCVLTL